MKFTLDITSKGTKGNELFDKVCKGLSILRDSEKEFGEDLEEVQGINTDLFIDGEQWMFTHDSELFLTGITKL